MMKAGYKSYES